MSFAITLDASAFGRAAGLLEREPERVERELRGLTQRRARLAKEALQRATPVGERQPGEPSVERPHMRELWHQETTGPSESVVFNTAAYSRYLFEGAGPHEIRARNARVLHFYAGGTDVFTPAVEHPGQAPDPTLLRALDDQLMKAEGDLFDYGVAEMSRLAHEIGVGR
jgi:hypothetical protein